MAMLNTALRALFDAILGPFSGMSPWISLVPISLLAAIGILLVFKRTSNQAALTSVKARITAGLFEIRLFNDDLRLMFRAQGDILRRSLTYMRLSLVPMLWTLPPLVLVIAQLQFHYGYEGLAPGQATQLSVVLAPSAVRGTGDTTGPSAKPVLRVTAPAGVRIVEPPVWVPTLREMSWRVEIDARGSYALTIASDDAVVSKSLDAGTDLARRSPYRVTGWLDELIYPAEPPLPADGPFERISIHYADAALDFFGFGLHWLIVFFVLSIVFALALRKPLGVTI